MSTASVERRTKYGLTFVPLQSREAVAPDEPVRLAVRDAPIGTVLFHLKRGSRSGPVEVGEWTTDVSPLDGGYAFVDLDPLRIEGFYTLMVTVVVGYVFGKQTDYFSFNVKKEAYEAATAPPTAPGEGTITGRLAQAGVSGVEGVAALPGALPDILPKMSGMMWAVAAVAGLVLISTVMKKRR